MKKLLILLVLACSPAADRDPADTAIASDGGLIRYVVQSKAEPDTVFDTKGKYCVVPDSALFAAISVGDTLTVRDCTFRRIKNATP